MKIINLLEKRNKKADKDGLDNFINYKINERIDESFKSDLDKVEMWVYAIAYSNKPLKEARKEKIKELEAIYKKYFDVSNSFQNKLDLLKCFTMMSEKYNSKLADFIKNNISEILEVNDVEEVITILNELKEKTQNIKDLIKYFSDIKDKGVYVDMGGIAPSYRDIQESNSISIGSEYGFQQA